MAHMSGNAKKEVSFSILSEFYIHQGLVAPLLVCSEEITWEANSSPVKIFVLS